MANYDVLKLDGTKSGSIELSDAVFGIEPNNSVLFEAINLQRASLRQGTHAVKNRSAVSGGGRKPWKQKEQGQLVKVQSVLHNGVAVVSYSTNSRSYAYKMPKKMRRLAFTLSIIFQSSREWLNCS